MDSHLATKDHLERVVRKRDALDATARETLEALVLQVSRARLSPREAVDLWQWARGLGLSGASTTIAEATGYSITHLSSWNRTGFPLEPGGSYAGDFPIEFQITPPKGTPCVYVLFDGEGRAVYIGQSCQLKNRLKQHRRDPRKAAVIRWWAMVCVDRADMNAREADLIREHQPDLNIAGR